MEKDAIPDQVEIFKKDIDNTLTTLQVKVLEDGRVSMAGHDIGEAPKRTFGRDEYEYSVTVPTEYKDHLLLLLIKERFNTDTPTTDFMEWLKSQGIPHEFSSWP